MKTEIKGDKLIITIDMSGPTKQSSSGKMNLLEGLSGWRVVDPNTGFKFSINAGFKA